MTPLLLLLFCCQDPAVATPQAASRPLDVVLLKNGDQLEGRITAQLDGYVEIQLEAGATVGVSIAQVAAVRRGAGAAAVAVAAPVAPRSEWFVLHDGRGEAVGWLHASVTIASDGVVTASEEYEFVDGARRYQITSMCTADAQLAPRSCYFRERISDPVLGVSLLPGIDPTSQQDRIAAERIVEATCRGDRLQVVRLDRGGRRERQVDWSAGSTFPLLARTIARHSGQAIAQATMFDPAVEELVLRTFDSPRLRRVTWEGKLQQVTEIAEASATSRNHEWLDASLRTLRRELAGPALVAMPSSAESARLLAGGRTIQSALSSEAGGTFGLWAPNPAWEAIEGQPPGQVALLCPAHGASIGLSRLDHLESDTPLESAVDAVANWFALLYPDLRIEGREPVVVRDRAAVRLLARGRSKNGAQQATVDVIPHHGQFLVLVCRAPAEAWDELAPDFQFLLRSVELQPQSLAPTLQGPLAERQKKVNERQAAAGGGAARSSPPRAQPLVRVPDDG